MRTNLVIKGEAKWASLFEVNDLSQKYEMNICNLDNSTVKALKELSIPVKEGEGDKEDYGHYIIAKTKIEPKVMDAAKNPWPNNLSVGNGSKVKVSVSPYDWNFKKKSGTSASLNAVMVIDFKEYTGGTTGLDVEKDGFVLDISDDIPFDTDDDL